MNDGQSNDTEAAEQRTARMLSDIGCIPSDKQCKWHSLKNSVCTIPATDATHTERSAPRTECTAIEAALSKIMLTTTGALRKIAYGKKVVFPRTTDSIVADFASRLGAGATASDLRAAEVRFGSSIEEIHSLLYEAIPETILRRQDDKHADCSLLSAAYDVWQGGPGVPVRCQNLMHEARTHPNAKKDFVGMIREAPARMEGQQSPSCPAAAGISLAPSAASVAPTSLNYRDPGREAKEAREARLRQTPRSLAATAIAICDDLPRTAEDQQACCGWLTAECGRAIRDSQSSVETACIEAHHTQSITNLKRFLAVVRDCDMSQDSFIAATMSEDEYGLVIDSDTPHEALQVQDIDDILPLGVRITMAGQDETGSSGPTVAGRPKRQLTLEMPMRPMPAPAGSAPALFASLPGAQVDLHGQHEGMTRGPQHSESGITGFGVVGVDPYAMTGFEQADWPPSAEQAMVGSSTAGPALDVFGNLGQGPWDANWPDMGDPRPQTIPVSPYGYTNKSLFLHGDDPFPMHAGPSQVDWQVPTDFGPPLAAAGATDAAADPRSAIHQSRETSTPSCAELNEYQRLGLDPTFSIKPQPPAEYTEAAQKTFQGKPWAVAGMTPAMREQLANDTAISNGMLDYRCDFTSAESDLTPWSTVSHILSNVTKIPRTAIQQAGCKQQLLTARGRLLAKAKHDSELGVHKHFEEASHLLDGTLEVLRTDTKTKMKAYLEALRQSAPGSASAGIDEGSLASQFRCLRQAVTSSDMPIKERIEETAPDEAVRRAESRADGLYAVAELNLA